VSKLRSKGHQVIGVIEDCVLVIIAISTVVAVCFEIAVMIKAMEVRLADLLLLFIYLEVLAMAGIYLNTGKLPVRIPLYIAVVSIARYMILDMKNLDTLRILGLSGAVLILALAILAMRFGHNKFPYTEQLSE